MSVVYHSGKDDVSFIMDTNSSRFLGLHPGRVLLLGLTQRICFSPRSLGYGTNAPAEVSHISEAYRAGAAGDDGLVSSCQKGKKGMK